jgi:prepilin-type N-terminal cleavage/methylation domain-containing protein
MKGFTLIELLVVIGIIVILMTAALVAINPFKQFAMANNASRWSGVTTTMNAISQAMVDGKGDFKCTPTGAAVTNCPATGDTVPITTAKVMADSTTHPTGYDICSCLVSTGNYMGTMPFDPQNGKWSTCSSYDTDYTIVCDTTTKRITVCAQSTQVPPESATICITR